MPAPPPPIRLGDPELLIYLPGKGETLGQRFSVFGSCVHITPSSSPTITVEVWDGLTLLDSKTADINQTKGTYEAFFDLQRGTSSGKNGKVVVKCSALTGDTTHDALTIEPQTTLTMNFPRDGNGFSSWGQVVAQGDLSDCAGKTFYLRMTDAGADIFTPVKEWTVDRDGPWSKTLTDLLGDARPTPSNKFNIHVSVWDGPMTGERIRLSSGYFSVER
jgi:hypothetical protein